MKIGGLKILGEPRPVGYVDASIGKLAIFDTSMPEFDSVTDSSVLELKTSDFAARLIPFIAHRTESLRENETKPDKPTLSAKQVSKLTEADVESILEAFLKSHEYLYRESKPKESINQDGQRVSTQTYGDTVLPREKGESNSQYLQRLLTLFATKVRNLRRKAAELSSNTAHFSKGLQQDIGNTLQIGDSLANLMEANRYPTMPGLTHPGLETTPQPRTDVQQPDSIDQNTLVEEVEEAGQAQLEGLYDRFDKLLDSSASLGEFLVEANETQTKIASEIRAAGSDASQIGKQSLNLTRRNLSTTFAVLGFAVLALILSEVHIWRGNGDLERLPQQADQFFADLRELTKTIHSDQKDSRSNIVTILSEMKQQRIAQEKEFGAILAGQADLIKQQVLDRSRDRETIEELRRKLSELETRVENSQQGEQGNSP